MGVTMLKRSGCGLWALCLATLGSLGAPAALADPPAKVLKTAPLRRPAGPVMFEAVLDLGQTAPGINPQLRGGQVVTSTDWPASLYVTFTTDDGEKASCTATLIGPEVVLTAAHCVPATGLISFKFKGQTPYDADCKTHPRYPGDASADFALCRLRKVFAAPTGFTYETVRTTNMQAVVGGDKYVILSGFGCTSDLVADQDKSDGKYRIGFGIVDESSASPTKLRGSDYYKGVEENNLFTLDDGHQTHANICPGDSGGPAFVTTGGGGKITEHRAVIAVNSRVFYADDTMVRFTSSLLAATGGPDFKSWALTWLGATSACGLKGALPNCRS